MRFHLLSDIHLEFYPFYPGLNYFIENTENADFICLCGDIGNPFNDNYARFLDDCINANYLQIFIVAGNHEFYGHTIDEVIQQIHQLCTRSDKLVFLNNSSFEIVNSNLIVLGTTLWSQITLEQSEFIEKTVNDFSRINGWSVTDNNQCFHGNVEFIEKNIACIKAIGKRLIILSHHAPLLECDNPNYSNSAISSAFQSDLRNLIENNSSKIAVWAYGHNHYSKRFSVKDTLIISNQFGYPDENCNESFDCVFQVN